MWMYWEEFNLGHSVVASGLVICIWGHNVIVVFLDKMSNFDLLQLS